MVNGVQGFWNRGCTYCKRKESTQPCEDQTNKQPGILSFPAKAQLKRTTSGPIKQATGETRGLLQACREERREHQKKERKTRAERT